MVERLHRQLKTAIKSNETVDWAKILPVVLMGIRTAWKEDLQATPAETVFREPIRLPGQFFGDSNTESDNTEDFAARLKKIMRDLQPKLWRHGSKTPFMYKDLATTKQVFLRYDAPAGALQSPMMAHTKSSTEEQKHSSYA